VQPLQSLLCELRRMSRQMQHFCVRVTAGVITGVLHLLCLPFYASIVLGFVLLCRYEPRTAHAEARLALHDD
jgi:hypothetical protein